MQKLGLTCMQTANGQLRLGNCAVWPEPSGTLYTGSEASDRELEITVQRISEHVPLSGQV